MEGPPNVSFSWENKFFSETQPLSRSLDSGNPNDEKVPYCMQLFLLLSYRRSIAESMTELVGSSKAATFCQMLGIHVASKVKNEDNKDSRRRPQILAGSASIPPCRQTPSLTKPPFPIFRFFVVFILFSC